MNTNRNKIVGADTYVPRRGVLDRKNKRIEWKDNRRSNARALSRFEVKMNRKGGQINA